MPVTNVSESNGIGMFSARLPFNPDAGDVQIARLTGDVGVIPERTAVFHLNVVPRLQSWSAELAEGIDLTQQRPSPCLGDNVETS